MYIHGIKLNDMSIKVGDKVKYDGEKHLVVNILKDGSPVLVPMSVIDDECYAVGIDELNN
jgi:autonomous glycyl radical cofactor GrcA